MSAPEPAAVEERTSRLVDVASVFLRLGLTAFGGPAAHVAMMERELVERRRWLSHERFLDMLGAANLIPGPSSSELAVFLGYERAGAMGLVLAGLCFVLPAALMTTAIAWAYVRYGSLPQAGGVLYGIKPVVLAIVAHAIWTLAPKALKKSRLLTALGALAMIASALGVESLAVLAGTGLSSLVVRSLASQNETSSKKLGALPLLAAGAAPTASASLGSIFLTFAKLGAVVFGSGYVLLAFLRADLVERLHWLTDAQVVDAVAVGQITPGPVFTAATFLGYLLAGGPGALVATVGIFLPGFLLVAVIRPLVARARASPSTGAFLDGVNVASLALMVVVTGQLARSVVIDAVGATIAIVSAIALVRFRIGTTWLLLGGAAVGLAARALQ